MKKIILSVLTTLALTVSIHSVRASENLKMIEGAIESEALSIKISKDLSGIITGKVCQRCETQVLKITPATQLFIAGKKVGLTRATTQSGKPGVAFYDLKTRLVTRIKIY
ncbi:MAG: hypothetical protein OEY29_11640 [Gammaproteobacteria bacterium]|nr:hypothetical protein [Gammaproteobacteria bacterium]